VNIRTRDKSSYLLFSGLLTPECKLFKEAMQADKKKRREVSKSTHNRVDLCKLFAAAHKAGIRDF